MRRAAAWAALLLVAVAASGCWHKDCDFSRSLTWEQDGFLEGDIQDRQVSHRQGALFGQATRILAEPPYTTLVQVWAYEPGGRVTRDQLVAFTRDLFAVNGFPEPTFEDAQEHSGCAWK